MRTSFFKPNQLSAGSFGLLLGVGLIGLSGCGQVGSDPYAEYPEAKEFTEVEYQIPQENQTALLKNLVSIVPDPNMDFREGQETAFAIRIVVNARAKARVTFKYLPTGMKAKAIDDSTWEVRWKPTGFVAPNQHIAVGEFQVNVVLEAPEEDKVTQDLIKLSKFNATKVAFQVFANQAAPSFEITNKDLKLTQGTAESANFSVVVGNVTGQPDIAVLPSNGLYETNLAGLVTPTSSAREKDGRWRFNYSLNISNQRLFPQDPKTGKPVIDASELNGRFFIKVYGPNGMSAPQGEVKVNVKFKQEAPEFILSKESRNIVIDGKEGHTLNFQVTTANQRGQLKVIGGTEQGFSLKCQKLDGVESLACALKISSRCVTADETKTYTLKAENLLTGAGSAGTPTTTEAVLTVTFKKASSTCSSAETAATPSPAGQAKGKSKKSGGKNS